MAFQAPSLAFNLTAIVFFLAFTIAPQRMLAIASFGRAKRLSANETIGWRIFAGFFALMSAYKAVAQLLG